MNDPATWLKTRQSLLRAIRTQVRLLLGPQSPDLAEYSKAYQAEFGAKKGWQASHHHEVMTSWLETRLLLGGDFHAYSQSQRTHLRFLRSLPSGSSIVLALECFFSSDQPHLDRYMNGKMSEAAFLRKISWNEKWGFPFESYRPLLQLAKARGFRVRGVNKYYVRRTVETLRKRDEHAADILYKIKNDHPEALIYCIYGDLHLAEPHLPKSLKKRFAKTRRPLTIVFQDSEKLYFDVVKKNQDTSVEVMSCGKHKFCILGSPPWVKWQSYLIYLEHTYDQDLEEDDESREFDFTDHIHSLVKILMKDLNLRLSTSDLAVYTAQDDFLSTKTKRAGNASSVLNWLVERDKSFYWVESSALYLSRFSTNHAASLAGTYLHYKLMKVERSPFQFPDDFVKCIWVEGIAFFLSKWINPKRKADSIREIQAQFRADLKNEKIGREALLLAIEQRLREAEFVRTGHWRELKRRPRSAFSYVEAARILGSILGENLFLHYKGGHLDQKTLLRWLEVSFDDETFGAVYQSALRLISKNGEFQS